MSRLVSHPYTDLILRARVTVLVTMATAVGALLNAGLEPLTAVAISLAGIAGGLEIGRLLIQPYFAPQVRVYVIVVIVVLIVNTVRSGHPAPECIAVVLGGAWCTAMLARQVTGLTARRPRRVV
jgi:hypothetical protein